MNTYNEVIEGLEDAERKMKLADILADRFAKLIIGRLRKTSGY